MPKRAEYRPIFSDLPLFAWASNAPDDFARAVRVPDYDVSSRKSGDQGGSAAANAIALPTKQQQREAVFAAVVRAGRDGLTCRDLCARWNMAGQLARLSGRFSELRDLGLIVRLKGPDGECVLRDGCGVWVEARFAR